MLRLISQIAQHIIATHILPKISRSKDNLTMKVGQLIEYNRNSFTENHTLNVVEKLVPDPLINDKN